MLVKIIKKFEYNYQTTVMKIARGLTLFFEAVPRRRERRLHIGFLSYQRKIGKTTFPRAISFTAAFYALGVPPELIGLGLTLNSLKKDELELVFKYYVNLKSDLIKYGRYFNQENLLLLARKNPAWGDVVRDVDLTEKILRVKLGPKNQNDFLHKNLSANVLLLKNKKETVSQLIMETGKLRKSLG